MTTRKIMTLREAIEDVRAKLQREVLALLDAHEAEERRRWLQVRAMMEGVIHAQAALHPEDAFAQECTMEFTRIARAVVALIPPNAEPAEPETYTGALPTYEDPWELGQGLRMWAADESDISGTYLCLKVSGEDRGVADSAYLDEPDLRRELARWSHLKKGSGVRPEPAQPKPENLRTLLEEANRISQRSWVQVGKTQQQTEAIGQLCNLVQRAWDALNERRDEKLLEPAPAEKCERCGGTRVVLATAIPGVCPDCKGTGIKKGSGVGPSARPASAGLSGTPEPASLHDHGLESVRERDRLEEQLRCIILGEFPDIRAQVLAVAQEMEKAKKRQGGPLARAMALHCDELRDWASRLRAAVGEKP